MSGNGFYVDRHKFVDTLQIPTFRDYTLRLHPTDHLCKRQPTPFYSFHSHTLFILSILPNAADVLNFYEQMDMNGEIAYEIHGAEKSDVKAKML